MLRCNQAMLTHSGFERVLSGETSCVFTTEQYPKNNSATELLTLAAAEKTEVTSDTKSSLLLY